MEDNERVDIESERSPDEPLADYEHQELSPRERHITEALDTVEAARTARDLIAQIEDDQYRSAFAEKWRTELEAAIATAEEERKKEQEYIDGPGKSRHDGYLLQSQNEITRLTGKIDYLKGRMENADVEIAAELECSKATARAIVENLAWALGELYDFDETKCAGLSAERLGQALTEESGWAEEVERAASKENNIMRRTQEANIVLANPKFPYLGLKELKEILRNIHSYIIYSDEYKAAKTREDWQAVLNHATQAGIDGARTSMRLSVEGDKKYIMRDL